MRKKREKLRPDLTPLIDVVFLLLVFFMSISSLQQKKSILSLELPEIAAPPSQEKPKNHTLEMSETKISFNEKVITIEELDSHLKGVKKSDIISIHIDKECRYEKIATVLQKLQNSGNVAIDLVVTPKGV